MLWVNEAIDRFPPLGYRARIVTCAAVAAGVPFLLLLGQGQIAPAIAAGVAALWFLFCVHRLLLPLRAVTGALDACVEALPRKEAEPPRDRDEIERMIANVDRVAELLDAAMSRKLDAMVALPSTQPSGEEASSPTQNPRRAAGRN